MPADNAYSFLRQSIAGNSGTGMQLSSDRFSKGQQDVNVQVPSRPVPPILVVPPDMDIKDFVNQIENAYTLDYTQSQFLHAKEDDKQANFQHSILLMDEGLAYMYFNEYRSASDMFSLCVILYPHYFYYFCLATCRYNLGDFSGALEQLRLALDLIRDKQPLPPEIGFIFEQFEFTDAFYGLFIITLLYNNQVDEAKAMADFVLEQDVFTSANTYLEVAVEFSLYGQKTYAAKCIDKAMPYVEQIEDQKVKDSLMSWIEMILTKSPMDMKK